MSKATHNDVLEFLESLDKLQTPTAPTPETKTSNVSSTAEITMPTGVNDGTKPNTTTESVLQFLDEITNTTTPATPVTTTASAIKEVQPNVGVTVVNTSTIETQQQTQQQPQNRWNWSSFWNQATNTMNQASQTVKVRLEEAQKNIEKNEKLKGLTSQFNKENIEKLGNDLKKLTVNVIDSIAPPILSKPENETVIWLQVNDNKDFSEQINDVVSYVKDEIFANSSSKKTILNNGKLSIKNEYLPKNKLKPASFGIASAIATAEELLTELVAQHPERQKKVQQIEIETSAAKVSSATSSVAPQTKSEKTEEPTTATAPTQTTPTANIATPSASGATSINKSVKEIITTYHDMFLIVQPYFINLTRPGTEKILTHTAFFLVFYWPNYEDRSKDMYISYTTQSVSCKENMENTTDEINPLRSQIYEEYCDDQKLKVIESGIWSLFEEMLVRKKEYSYDAQTVAGLSGQVL